MCLITKQSEPIILREDLKVYKILTPSTSEVDIAYSEFQAFKYSLNKLYATKIEEHGELLPYDKISEEKYFGNADWFQRILLFQKKKFKSYREGFHFIKTLKRCNRKELDRNECVYKCIIPKGSEVYFDETDLGVANQIIILKLL